MLLSLHWTTALAQEGVKIKTHDHVLREWWSNSKNAKDTLRSVILDYLSHERQHSNEYAYVYLEKSGDVYLLVALGKNGKDKSLLFAQDVQQYFCHIMSERTVNDFSNRVEIIRKTEMAKGKTREQAQQVIRERMWPEIENYSMQDVPFIIMDDQEVSSSVTNVPKSKTSPKIR